METRQVGASGLLVPTLGLGTMTWGTTTDVHEAGAILTEFLDAGGRLVDVARWHGSAVAEEMLGTLLEASVSRSDVVLSVTGAWRQTTDGTERDSSRGGLLGSLDASLDRLGTDHVDLFVVTGPDGTTSWHETVSALDIAVSTGRAHYVGVSGVNAWQAVRAATLLESRGLALTAVSAELSLLRREDELEHEESNVEIGAGLIGWSPLGRGVLTGKYRRTVPADSRAADPALAPYVDELLNDRCAGIVEAVVTASQGLGLTPTQLSLAWSLTRPGAAATVVGPRTVAQLRDALAVEDVALPETVVEVLDEVSSPL